MTNFIQIADLQELPRRVVETFNTVLNDEDIKDGWYSEEIMENWIISGFYDYLSEIGVEPELLTVRICSEPLGQYDKPGPIPNASYRMKDYISVGEIFIGFKFGSEQSDNPYGPGAFFRETPGEMVELTLYEKAQDANLPGANWYSSYKISKYKPYVHQATKEKIIAAAKQQFAEIEAFLLEQKTSAPKEGIKKGFRL